MTIDEIVYLTLGAGAGNLFFQLVNARYGRGAMILTSNRGFSEWGRFLAVRGRDCAVGSTASPRRGRATIARARRSGSGGAAAQADGLPG